MKKTALLISAAIASTCISTNSYALYAPSHYNSLEECIADANMHRDEDYAAGIDPSSWYQSQVAACNAEFNGQSCNQTNPASPTTMVTNLVVKNQVVVMAETGDKKSEDKSGGKAKRKSSRPQLLGADIYYNDWDAAGNEGRTYGINPTYAIGDRHAFTFMLPISASDPDSGEGSKSVGLDLNYRFSMTDTFALGAHLNSIGLFNDDNNLDDTYNVAVGSYASFLWQLSKNFGVSTGTLLEYVTPEKGDSTLHLIPALNLGFNFTESLAVNVYGMYYLGLDVPDNTEDSYIDGGIELSWLAGAWALRGGVKNTFSYDNFDSTEYYLGAALRF